MNQGGGRRVNESKQDIHARNAWSCTMAATIFSMSFGGPIFCLADHVNAEVEAVKKGQRCRSLARGGISPRIRGNHLRSTPNSILRNDEGVDCCLLFV